MERERLEVPMFRDRPMCAYVKRLEPTHCRGRRVPEQIGRIDYICNIYEDLIAEVARKHGGQRFRGRIYDQTNKKDFLGVLEFEIAADPLIDGEPIPPKRPKAEPASTLSAVAQVEPERIEAKRRRRRAKAMKRHQKRAAASGRVDNAVQEFKALVYRNREDKAREVAKRRKAREEALKARREDARRAAERLRRAFRPGPTLSFSRDSVAGSSPASTSDHDAEPEREELMHVAEGIDWPDPNDDHGGDADECDEFESDVESLTFPTSPPQVASRPPATAHGTPIFDHVSEMLHERALAARSRPQPTDWSTFESAFGKLADAVETRLLKRGGDE